MARPIPREAPVTSAIRLDMSYLRSAGDCRFHSGPVDESRTPAEARSERGKGDAIPIVKAPLLARFEQCDRYRAGGGVAAVFDIGEHLVPSQARPLCDRVED